jgi:hypothetical protein
MAAWCSTIGQSLQRFLVGAGIERHRRAADCMPGGDPADESPGVIAALSQLGHGPTTDLKSVNAINRDWTTRQHIDASGGRYEAATGSAFVKPVRRTSATSRCASSPIVRAPIDGADAGTLGA